jgi:hypothetical protein
MEAMQVTTIDSESDECTTVAESAEDTLQLVLSGLAQLPWSSRMIGIASDNGVDDLVDGIWRELTANRCSRKSLHLSFQEERKGEWDAIGLEMLALSSSVLYRLSPTELHSTVSSCIVLGDERDKLSPTTTIPATREGIDVYYLICILLCCIALHKCPNEIEKRWKRWQSMQLETIRLYQQYTPGLTKLWCEYVLPATSLVQEALTISRTYSLPTASASNSAATTSTSTVPQTIMAYPAAAVHCTTKWVIDHFMENESKFTIMLLQTMFGALDRFVLRGNYEILYEHPLRKHFCRDMVDERQRQLDDGSVIIATEARTLAKYTLVDKKEQDEDEWDLETLSVDMETIWSDWGIAVIAATAGWNARPLVWSPWYTWRLFHLHVDVLLIYENEMEEDEDSSSKSISHRLKVFGYLLLESLLQVLPDASMSIRGGDGSGKIIGTCQLIANQILESASQENKSDMRSMVVPDSAWSFQLLKRVVSRYRPIDQLRIVRCLMEDCPHPALRPKLLDLLRSSIRWNDTQAEHGMWQYLNSTFLTALDGHMDCKSTSLMNVNGLIDNCEVYCAVFGIMQLFIVNEHKPFFESLSDVRLRLDRFHGVLKRSMRDWDSQSSNLTFSPPSNYYRINLLESILAQVIEGLSVDP